MIPTRLVSATIIERCPLWGAGPGIRRVDIRKCRDVVFMLGKEEIHDLFSICDFG